MNKVLIVVDMQEDFVYGALGTPEARNIVFNVVEKCAEAQLNGDTLIFTKDLHYEEDYTTDIEGKYVPPHCMSNEDGHLFIPELLGFPCFQATKSTYGYQFWGDWNGLLGDIDQIELCGVCTDICVISNALGLRGAYPSIPIIVDASCCAGSSPRLHRAAIEVMKSCNIEVINEEE